MKKIHFGGLNEVRAIAAIFVLFHHIELYKFRSNLPSLYDTSLHYFISNLGKNGVYIFFILSGFLITYLLLHEKKIHHKVNVFNFYMRRIFRIWPLYYLIIFISFLIIPYLSFHFKAFQNEIYYYNLVGKLSENSSTLILWFLFFIPNLALKFYPPVVGASHTWSVGVEEQFYLIWPHLIQSKYFHIILPCIAFLPCVKVGLCFFSKTYSENFVSLLSIFPIHYMAFGAIGAYFIYFYNQKTLPFFTNPILFFLNSVFMISLLFFKSNYLIFGLLTTIQLLFIIQKDFKINLRNRFLDNIGMISYGIYMYHPFVMFLSFTVFNSVIILNSKGWLYHFVIYVSTFLVTYIISYFSFTLYEKKFIDLKNKKFTIP